VPLTQDIVTNTITERMDALRNDLKQRTPTGTSAAPSRFAARRHIPLLLGGFRREKRRPRRHHLRHRFAHETMHEITLQQLAQQMSGMPDVHNPDWATACS
jgi:hypothetical protein